MRLQPVRGKPACLLDLFGRHPAGGFITTLGRAEDPLRRSDHEPVVGLWEILRHAVTISVNPGELELARAIALLSGSCEPLCGFCGALWDAHAIVVHQSEELLGVQVAVVCGLVALSERFGIILRDAVAP